MDETYYAWMKIWNLKKKWNPKIAINKKTLQENNINCCQTSLLDLINWKKHENKMGDLGSTFQTFLS